MRTTIAVLAAALGLPATAGAAGGRTAAIEQLRGELARRRAAAAHELAEATARLRHERAAFRAGLERRAAEARAAAARP